MPQLSRPDGARIHWDQRGEGPALHVSHSIVTATPSTFDALLTDLAGDHRVVTWDPRGAGRSTHDRPYDLETDVGDLIALIEEVGERTVTISIGGPVPPALVVAERRPEPVAAVVVVGAVGLAPSTDTDPESMIDSESVTAAILQMARTDPRGLRRAGIALTNPQLDDAGVRARLEAQLAYCPVEPWVERTESLVRYLSDAASGTCAALGDRLWLVHWEDAVSPGRPMTRMRALFPDVHIVEVEDGPITRPDLTAAVIREVTATLRPR